MQLAIPADGEAVALNSYKEPEPKLRSPSTPHKMSCIVRGSRVGSTTGFVSKAHISRQPTNLNQQQTVKFTLRKLGISMFVIFVLVVVTVPFIVLSIISRIRDGGLYSDHVDDLADRYSAREDFVEYVLIFLASFAVYYTWRQ